MNIKSCDYCGTVVDMDKIGHHEGLYSKENGEVNEDYWMWEGGDYVRYVK